MKNKIKLKIFGCCFILLVPILSYGQIPSNDNSWEINFQDHFNIEHLTNWHRDTGIYYAASPNHDLEENIDFIIKNGKSYLRIRNNNDNPDDTRPFSSGSYNTNSLDFGYGFYEFSVQFPNVQGCYPTLWLLGNGAEIDIFEGFNHHYNNLHSNVHFDSDGDGDLDSFSADTDLGAFGFSVANELKVAIEWNPNTLIWYINEVPVREIFHNTIVPNVSMGIRISHGVSADPSRDYRDSCPPGTSGSCPYPTSFPNYLHVDYFKYYVLKNPIPSTKTVSYTIGSSENKTERATNYVTLDKGFTVQSGATFTAITYGN
jgi:beta-glucanase (GH16 family)